MTKLEELTAKYKLTCFRLGDTYVLANQLKRDADSLLVEIKKEQENGSETDKKPEGIPGFVKA